MLHVTVVAVGVNILIEHHRVLWDGRTAALTVRVHDPRDRYDCGSAPPSPAPQWFTITLYLGELARYHEGMRLGGKCLNVHCGSA